MTNEMITVKINGKNREVPSGLTIDGLLDHLKVKKAAAIVEHNFEVLKAADHAGAAVSDGDNIEIVKFVGGG